MLVRVGMIVACNDSRIGKKGLWSFGNKIRRAFGGFGQERETFTLGGM